MGIRIYSTRRGLDQSQHDRVILRLECDGGGHGMFAPPADEFWHADGFITMHDMAMQAGWIERQAEHDGRQWICPECSGKRKRKC